MNSSWKTNLFGILAGIGGGIAAAYALKPELFAGFPKWVPGAGLLLSSIASACLGLVARDNDKSSEQVGAGGQGSVPISKALNVLLLASLTASLIFGLVACQTPAERVTYDAVAAPAMTVDHAMQAWGDYVHQNHPRAAQEQQVKDLFTRAKAAELAAIDAGHVLADLEGSGSTNTLTQRALSAAASTEATQTLNDLVQLLRTFGVSL